jgi:flavin reductase (DIM6/NTAB) family NADH-FMN oxidoreductase RutF
VTGVGEVTPAVFRGFMAGFPSGVVVVTTVGGNGEPLGLTCSSLCSVSVEPPLLLVCIANASRTLHALQASGLFAVNLLHEDARHVARTFATGGPDRFGTVDWAPTEAARMPRLERDAHAVAECAVHELVVAGDHTIVIGEVLEVQRLLPTAPLLYGMQQYAAWSAGQLTETQPAELQPAEAQLTELRKANR